VLFRSLDVCKVFFTPRLSNERARIATSISESETVADLFAGVGPFSILIAKRARDVTVHAVELNEFAYRYLIRNISANKVSNSVIPHFGDARVVSNTAIRQKCDRIIMNLPFSSELFLESATNALKPSGGVIHLYSTMKGHFKTIDTFSGIERQLAALGWGFINLENSKIVREVGPRVYNTVFDIRVSE
jgi:tRNA (guanine37-N1)-methyltransferase